MPGTLETRAAEPSPGPHSPLAPGQPYPHPLLLYGLLTVMVLLWAGNYVVAKAGFHEVDGLTIGVLRVLIAAIFLVPIHAAYRWRHPLRRPLRWRDFAMFGCLGLFVGLNQLLFIYGLSYTTVEHSALIIAIGPVIILLLAALAGLERLTISKLAGVALAFAGVTLLAAGRGFAASNPTLRGDLLTLGGSTAFSFYAVIGKHVTRRYDTMTLNSWSYFLGALLLTPLAFHQMAHTDWSRVGWIGWGSLFYIGLGPSLIGYLIWFWALRHLAASRMGVITYVQPVLGSVIGVYLLHEALTGHILLSGILVLAGVALVERHTRGTEAEDESGEAPS